MAWVAIEIRKILSLAPPNQIFIEVKVLGDHAFATLTLGHFGQTKEYNVIDCLLLIARKKMEKEKDELRVSNLQLWLNKYLQLNGELMVFGINATRSIW